MKKDNKDIPKSKSKFTPEEIEIVAKNYRVLNILFYSSNSNEFILVSACEIAKELRKILVSSY